MQLTRRIPDIAIALIAAAACTARGATTPVMRTQYWGNSDREFAVCDRRIASMRGRNLLRRPGIKLVDSAGLGYGTAKMLFDGTAGVRVSTGRVGINGRPAVLTFYLGEPKVISQVGVFTFNSDARANQDFEVRLAKGKGGPGAKPKFPSDPQLTTGPTILGKNTGGFHTYFRAPGGGALTPERVDWVQFRIWPTYSQRAGSPAKNATKATSWTSLVELEVLGGDDDVIWIPDDDFAQRDDIVRTAVAAGIAEKDSWQESLMQGCKAIAPALVAPKADSGFRPFVGGDLRAGDKAQRIDISVAGLKRLWLETGKSAGNPRGSCALWGDPVLVDGNGKAVSLVELKPLYSTASARETRTYARGSGPVPGLVERKLESGLCVPASSRVCYALDGKYERFQAWAGVTAPSDKRTGVEFRVLSLPSAQDATAAAWERVRQLYRDPDSRREIAWEEEDRIWGAAATGDYKALAQKYAAASHRHAPSRAAATKAAASVKDAAGLAEVRDIYHRSRRVHEAIQSASMVPFTALRMAVEDLSATHGKRYQGGETFLRRIAEIEQMLEETANGAASASKSAVSRYEQIARDARELQREALLANPLLAFDELLIVRRKANRLGLPANWQSNSSVPKTGYDNEIARLSISRAAEGVKSVYRPQNGEYVGDVDLHFDADRMLVSMPSGGGKGPWHVHELRMDGTGPRQITQTTEPCVNNYDACYLPDDRIVFTSTAGMVAVPCVRGNAPVATLFRMNADGGGMRQLCFDQEHSWYPAVMGDGRVLYTRWEYADLPHSNSRMLFTANPDGTNQRAYYGSNSFWPNSIFYARPIPGHATKVVGTITGHHAPARMGELIVFDPALGTHEADGVVQRIPGYGKPVEPLIRDGLTGGSWPKFLHPYPLSENYYLVSCKPTPKSNWGIYLVDVFDNMLLISEEPGYALLEPLPLRKTPRPPVIPDRVDLSRSDAVIVVSDIYAGPGLKGIPRGEVKQLRVYTYTFGYNGVGGLYGSIGMDGPWDMRRTLGTVPVAADGSVMFRAPANTPIAVQPLDSEGKALQIMRSWFTAMPGETLSCVGCHEGIKDAPPVAQGVALREKPSEITPWYGEARNYEFQREVQPVLDRYCLGCHDGGKPADGPPRPDLRGTVMLKGWSTKMAGNTGKGTGGRFSVAYGNLHRYVRRPGIESPMPLMTPMEFHADTTELVQMLVKGHHGVVLDEEAWDRLITWIDFNAPYHGRWSTIVGEGARAKEDVRARLRELYANVNENHEVLPDAPGDPIEPILPPKPAAAKQLEPQAAGWPFDEAQAKRLQAEAAAGLKDGPGRPGAGATSRLLDLGDGVAMELVYIPAGKLVMGTSDGYADENPRGAVQISEDFWMGKLEVSNTQFRRFDPTHDSREEDRHGYQFGIPGYTVNLPDMPAVRLSWREAMEFCDWLSAESGWRVTLPTEAQWEWACRAGTDTPFHYGGFDTNFAPYANLGDAMLADFSGNPYKLDPAVARYKNPENPFDNWIPQDARFNDGGFVSADVGGYKPNAWGLHDMHGNVAEWTLSRYVPYPYKDDDRNAVGGSEITKRVVRGGSWYDRPKRSTSSYRFGYRDYQKVYNVGFRVLVSASRKTPRRVAAR